MATNDERINGLICSRCHIGMLEPHNSLINWVRCPICGFCKEVPSTKSEVDRITGNVTTRE